MLWYIGEKYGRYFLIGFLDLVDRHERPRCEPAFQERGGIFSVNKLSLDIKP